MLERDPRLMTARQVLIDYLIRSQDWHDAIDEIDAALLIAPDRGNLYAVRLGALQELGRTAEVEAQLQQMSKQFPDDEGVKQLLVQHYIDHKNLDAAEEFLRADIDPEADRSCRGAETDCLSRSAPRASNRDHRNGPDHRAEWAK